MRQAATGFSQQGLVGTGEVSRALGVHRATVVRWASEGRIPGAVQLDTGLWRFDPYQVARWAAGELEEATT